MIADEIASSGRGIEEPVWYARNIPKADLQIQLSHEIMSIG
jgi:hypothetical protein